MNAHLPISFRFRLYSIPKKRTPQVSRSIWTWICLRPPFASLGASSQPSRASDRNYRGCPLNGCVWDADRGSAEDRGCWTRPRIWGSDCSLAERVCQSWLRKRTHNIAIHCHRFREILRDFDLSDVFQLRIKAFPPPRMVSRGLRTGSCLFLLPQLQLCSKDPRKICPKRRCLVQSSRNCSTKWGCPLKLWTPFSEIPKDLSWLWAGIPGFVMTCDRKWNAAILRCQFEACRPQISIWEMVLLGCSHWDCWSSNGCAKRGTAKGPQVQSLPGNQEPCWLCFLGWSLCAASASDINIKMGRHFENRHIQNVHFCKHGNFMAISNTHHFSPDISHNDGKQQFHYVPHPAVWMCPFGQEWKYLTALTSNCLSAMFGFHPVNIRRHGQNYDIWGSYSAAQDRVLHAINRSLNLEDSGLAMIMLKLGS